jgi:hypothetical protein
MMRMLARKKLMIRLEEVQKSQLLIQNEENLQIVKKQIMKSHV